MKLLSLKSTHPVTGRRDLYQALTIIGIMLTLYWLWDVITYPWAHSVAGPTLTGDWQGELVTSAGPTQVIGLTLGTEGAGRRGYLTRLTATAVVCDAHGIHTYEWSGKPANWRATQFHMELSGRGEEEMARQRENDVVRIKLDGEWDRKDTIQARTALEERGPSSITITRSEYAQASPSRPPAPAPISLTLHRASERDLVPACLRLPKGT